MFLALCHIISPEAKRAGTGAELCLWVKFWRSMVVGMLVERAKLVFPQWSFLRLVIYKVQGGLIIL